MTAPTNPKEALERLKASDQPTDAPCHADVLLEMANRGPLNAGPKSREEPLE